MSARSMFLGDLQGDEGGFLCVGTTVGSVVSRQLLGGWNCL